MIDKTDKDTYTSTYISKSEIPQDDMGNLYKIIRLWCCYISNQPINKTYKYECNEYLKYNNIITYKDNDDEIEKKLEGILKEMLKKNIENI